MFNGHCFRREHGEESVGVAMRKDGRKRLVRENKKADRQTDHQRKAAETHL